MEEQPGLSDQYRKASPWPLFIAVGLAIAEVGVFLDVVAFAVGGLLLFVGSIAGILNEAGYLATPWPFVGGLGMLLAVIGIAIMLLYPGDGGAIDVGLRAVAIAIAGVLCMGGSILGRVLLRDRAAL
ncbi:DUF7541 family protein [Halalkalicoccus ordinarius]|uniref:DUF7541 family protein n=1 Tax=Halalkalicoccus ordinarius TaxID=3116651 RepID=UPI00300E7882